MPRHEISAADASGDGLRDRAQELVACLVAKAVVHELEAVEVEHEQRPGAATVHEPVELLVEPAPVPEAGQRIAARELRQPPLAAAYGR